MWKGKKSMTVSKQDSKSSSFINRIVFIGQNPNRRFPHSILSFTFNYFSMNILVEKTKQNHLCCNAFDKMGPVDNDISTKGVIAIL